MKLQINRRPLLGLLALMLTGFLPLAPAVAQDETQDTRPAVEVLYGSSLWRKVDYDVRGTYRIEQRTEGDSTQRFLVLGDDFTTKAGPDLKVVLSPTASDDVKGKTALRGSTILAPLTTNSGRSEYEIPARLDLGDFESVLIHCEQYTKLWAAAPLEAGQVLASGTSWTKKANKITGSWEIARVGERLELRLADNYKTKKGPDLKFILSPQTVSAASGSNATSRSLILSPLATHKGAQRFTLPAGTDLADYQSLLLHCEEYSKLWGASAL